MPLTVELAYQPADRALGLGYREELAAGTGMLFLFERPEPQSFWMRGIQFCIDVIWIENEVIQGAAESVCPRPPGTADGDLPHMTRTFRSPTPGGPGRLAGCLRARCRHAGRWAARAAAVSNEEGHAMVEISRAPFGEIEGRLIDRFTL